MSSFNTYGSRSAMVGGSVPVWLGTVTPLPAGYKVFGAEAGWKIPAGSPVRIGYDVNDHAATPVFIFAPDGNDGYIPAGDYGTFVPKVGMAIVEYDVNDSVLEAVIASVTKDGSGSYTFTLNSGSLSGDYAVGISPAGEFSATSYAYSYNDVVLDKDDENPQATVAAVVAHNEGILIERTPSGSDGIMEYLEKEVPNVIQVFE